MSNLQEYNKNFCPMPISDLLDGKHHFLIPSFQRGFRWEEKQVTDLLEDIKQFAYDENVKSNSYFLQPIIVKPRKYNGIDTYEVLDGQQRLTTMLLILKEILGGYMNPNNTKKYSPLLYDITYTNRPRLNFDDLNAANNIDSYYLREAYDVIKNWCDQNNEYIDSMIPCLFYSAEAAKNRQVKIIWYAIEEDSDDLKSINIFNRLNKGKISLTSSELIKALFIMDYDHRAEGDSLPAEQLSMEWNEMERKFQDDNFWYFISNDQNDTQTRIDILFDFVTRRGINTDSDYSYREFQKLYDFCRARERNSNHQQQLSGWLTSKNIDTMEKAWKIVRRTFDRLVAWYEDSLYYHYVGYLIAVGFTPLEIFKYLETEKEERKDRERKLGKNYEWTVEDTKISLRKLMMQKFKKGSKFLEKADIDAFEYKSEYVSRVLLLFNVECCRKGQNIRFPFDKYKKQNWDVEHIDSQNEATLEKYEDRMRWLQNVKFILRVENTKRSIELANECQILINEFEEKKQVKKEKYNEFYIRINKFYSEEKTNEKESEVDLTTQKKDYLSNLTLLDSATNREYQDAPFAYKRYCIVQYDKKGEWFIPLCTRNVFLKYFTDSNEKSSYLDFMRWNSSDREGYIKAIHEAVDPIFDSVVMK